MKVALCFFGQPRLIDNPYTYTSHHNCILNKYETDVYAHCWISDKPVEFTYSDWGIRMGLNDIQSNNTIPIILNQYSPKKYIFEEPRKFFLEQTDREKVQDMDYYSINNENNLMSHLYSMSKSIELIDDDIDYDCVILSRYDNYIESFPDLESLDLDNLYLSDRWGHFWDHLILGGPRQIKTLNCIDNFSNLCNTVENFTAEQYKKAAFNTKYSLEKRIKLEVGIVRTLTLENLQI